MGDKLGEISSQFEFERELDKYLNGRKKISKQLYEVAVEIFKVGFKAGQLEVNRPIDLAKISRKGQCMLDDYLTDEDVMDKFGVSKGTLANYRSKGKLPYSKFMGKIVYKVVDIKDFLERNSVKKTG